MESVSSANIWELTLLAKLRILSCYIFCEGQRSDSNELFPVALSAASLMSPLRPASWIQVKNQSMGKLEKGNSTKPVQGRGALHHRDRGVGRRTN